MLNEAVVAVVAVVVVIRSAAAHFHVEAHPIRVDHVEDRPILVLHHTVATHRHRAAAARTARPRRRAATPHRAAVVHIVRLLQAILIITLPQETIVDTVLLVVVQYRHAVLLLRPHIVAPQPTV